ASPVLLPRLRRDEPRRDREDDDRVDGIVADHPAHSGKRRRERHLVSKVLHGTTEAATLVALIPAGHVIVAVEEQLDLGIALKEPRPPRLILLPAIRVGRAVGGRRVLDRLV